MSALRSSPSGFNSARAQSTGHKVDDDTFRGAFQSTGGFDRQQSGNLPREFNKQGMPLSNEQSASQRTLSNSNQGSQRVIKQNTYMA